MDIKHFQDMRQKTLNDINNLNFIALLKSQHGISTNNHSFLQKEKQLKIDLETIDSVIENFKMNNDNSDEIKQNMCEIYSDEQIINIEKKMENRHHFGLNAIIIRYERSKEHSLQVYKQLKHLKHQIGIQRIISGVNRKKFDSNITEVYKTGKLFINVGKKIDMNSFRNFGKLKKFRKQKCEINGFEFKIYVLPNVGNGFVQFRVKLATLPDEIESVAVYIQLFEKKSKINYYETFILDYTCDIGWSNQLLLLKDCLNYKKLQFGYKIQILRIYYYDKMREINDYCKNPLLNCHKFDWNWKLNKNIISSFQQCTGKKKLLLFYNENSRYYKQTNGSVCVSLALKPDSTNISVTLHVFKLPPKTEKLQVLFEVMCNKNKKMFINYKKMGVFDYNTNECIVIELNQKQSSGLLAVHNGVKLEFKVTVLEIWFRGCMDKAYEVSSNYMDNPYDENKTENKIDLTNFWATHGNKIKIKDNKVLFNHRSGNTNVYSFNTVYSTIKLSTGIHDMKIKVLQDGCCIGITSTRSHPNSYGFGKNRQLNYGYCSEGKIYSHKYGNKSGVKYGVSGYNNGDIISVIVDLNNFHISFLKNDETEYEMNINQAKYFIAICMGYGSYVHSSLRIISYSRKN